MKLDCFECAAVIEADEPEALGDSFLAHARAQHDWPFPDQGIRNYAEATQRLTGGSERLPVLGELTVHPVTEARLDDWLAFFDHDAFVGKPEWAACYCLEPHARHPAGTPEADEPDADPHWRENREAMTTRLRAGHAFGYLAYVDGKPAGWVNASRRSDYTLYRTVASTGIDAGDVIGVSCFIIAPPYRRHGLAEALLDRVLDDAPSRGVARVEAYPFNDVDDSAAGNFRGLRSMYEARGFEPVEVRDRDTVMRRRVAQ